MESGYAVRVHVMCYSVGSRRKLSGDGVPLVSRNKLRASHNTYDDHSLPRRTFFVLACPLVAAFTPDADLFASGGTSFSHGIRLTFWIVYGVLFLWTLLLFLGIIAKPLWIRSALAKICSLRFLKRWQSGAVSLGDNMVATSKELKSRPLGFGSKYSEARLCLGLHAILWSTRSSWLSFLSAILPNGSSSPGNS